MDSDVPVGACCLWRGICTESRGSRERDIFQSGRRHERFCVWTDISARRHNKLLCAPFDARWPPNPLERLSHPPRYNYSVIDARKAVAEAKKALNDGTLEETRLSSTISRRSRKGRVKGQVMGGVLHGRRLVVVPMLPSLCAHFVMFSPRLASSLCTCMYMAAVFGLPSIPQFPIMVANIVLDVTAVSPSQCDNHRTPTPLSCILSSIPLLFVPFVDRRLKRERRQPLLLLPPLLRVWPHYRQADSSLSSMARR